ncbi:hypothetical protein DYB37_011850 [Aphanomyces astaci]|uniref:Uncharacterized protein n=1 Tax=Aphanomyces astaci TaxID=112090 RepID=A0A418FNF1_APHAT|nr:hypothetical protein DYB37_011850 [Aphanomyces astaci]
MKTAGLLSILAVAAANQHKISPSVFELLQQSSTVTVFVAIERAFDLHKRSSLHDNTKCSSPIGTIFLCKELTEDDIFTAAALPEVEEIFPVPDSSTKPVVSDDVAAADRDKIVASSVLESLQQSSTVNVLVEHDYLGTLEMPESSSLFTHPKCKGGLLSGQVDCKDLTKEEIYSIAALPEVFHILPARDNSVSDTPNVTPKPTTTPKPAVTTPKPVVSDDDAVDNQNKIGPGVLQSLQQSTTVTVSVIHDDSPGSMVDKFHKCFNNPPLPGVFLCNDLTLDEVNRFAALPEVKEILATSDNSVSDIPNIPPKPTTTAATPTNSACTQQRDSWDDRD